MVMLVPKYAFRETETADPAIYLSHISLGGPENMRTQYSLLTNHKVWKMINDSSGIAANGLQDPWLVQAALTDQKMEASFPLENIKYQTYTSPGGRLSHLIQRKDEKKEGSYTDLGPGTEQLWSEVGREEEKPKPGSITASSSSNGRSRRPGRIQPHQQPGYQEVPLRRMAIFIHRLEILFRSLWTVIGMRVMKGEMMNRPNFFTSTGEIRLEIHRLSQLPF